MICNIQPNCDDICFDQMNSTFCNELKLADGCNQFDRGNNSILSIHYSKVPNKDSATIIDFRKIFQRLCQF